MVAEEVAAPCGLVGGNADHEGMIDHSGWHFCPSPCKWLVVAVVYLTLEPTCSIVLGCYLVLIPLCDTSKALLKSCCDETFLNFSHV